jgi:hypothetical protein
MVQAIHNPSLIIDVSIFGATLGFINLALFQWLRTGAAKRPGSSYT